VLARTLRLIRENDFDRHTPVVSHWSGLTVFEHLSFIGDRDTMWMLERKWTSYEDRVLD
jgi:hypothetical protein